MLTKTLLLSVLIGIAAAEKSFYSSRNCSESQILRAKNTKLPCVSKLKAYKAMVEHVTDKFDQFYKLVESGSLGVASPQVIWQNRTELEHLIFETLSSFALDIQTLNMVKQQRLDHCRTSLEKTAKQIENLAKSMKSLMKDITYKLINSSLPRTTIYNYRKPLLLATRIAMALDLSIKASRGLMNLGLWMEGKVFGSGSASNLVSTQETTVAEFESMLSEILKEELGSANVGPRAAVAVQKGAAALMEHLRCGNKAFEAVKEAERAQLSAAQASDEAVWLTEIASSSGANEDAVIAARKAQADRARKDFNATQATKRALAMRVTQASKIAETDDEAQAMLIAAETWTVAAVKGEVVPEGAAVARAAAKGAILTGAAVGFAGAAVLALDLVVPPGVGVVALIGIAIKANQIAHDELLKEHADRISANPIIERKKFAIDLLNWLIVTINVKHY